MPTGDFQLGEHVPAQSETATVGPIVKRVVRGSPEFASLVSYSADDVVFKDEEGTGADRMMTANLMARLSALAALVTAEWAQRKLRVTEAWDENGEHAENSLHYEGRAADLTVSDVDSGKLGRLARLAVNAGFDWVWYENASHVHVSVKK